ncbi:MAG: hypothetical protein WCY37_00195 [Candidatus Dojkabacteria bacterium]
MENVDNADYKKKSPFKFALPLILLLVIGIIGFGVYEYFRIAPRDVRFTNVTSSSVTVSWNTKSPTSATALVFKGEALLPLSIFGLGGERFYDTRDVRVAELNSAAKAGTNRDDLSLTMDDFETEIVVEDMGEYYTHHVTITGLDSETEYSFMVGDQLLFPRVKDINRAKVVKTLVVPESIESPYPAYGSVKDAGGSYEKPLEDLLPVSDAIVYFNYYDELTEESSSVFSSPVTEDGNWYMDVSMARDSSGQSFLETYGTVDSEIFVDLVVDAGEYGIWDVRSEDLSMSPAEPVVVNFPEKANVIDVQNPMERQGVEFGLLSNPFIQAVLAARPIGDTPSGCGEPTNTCQFVGYCGPCQRKCDDGYWYDCNCPEGTLTARNCTGAPSTPENPITCGGVALDTVEKVGTDCKVCSKVPHANGYDIGKWVTDNTKYDPAKNCEERDTCTPRTCAYYSQYSSSMICTNNGEFTCTNNEGLSNGCQGTISCWERGAKTQYCGDGDCTNGETSGTCPADCGQASCECGSISYTTFNADDTSWPINPQFCPNGCSAIPQAGLPAVSSDFPGKGEFTFWSCQASGRDTSPNCYVNRLDDSAAQGPEDLQACPCGTRARIFINADLTNWSEVDDLFQGMGGSSSFNSNFCGIGCEPGYNPSFPSPGESVHWNCNPSANYSDVYETIRCTASNQTSVTTDDVTLFADNTNEEVSGYVVMYIDGGALCPSEDAYENDVLTCICNDGYDLAVDPGNHCRQAYHTGDSLVCLGAWGEDASSGDICEHNGTRCQESSGDLLCNGAPAGTKNIEEDSNKRIAFSGSVLAQSTEDYVYVIDSQTGLFSGLQAGIYVTDYEGQTYAFDVTKTGENVQTLLYIDENDNGQYDEGLDINISEYSETLNIVPLELVYNYDLKEGFNFLSFPFLIDTIYDYATAASVLKQLNDQYSDALYSISKYDGRWKIVGQNTEMYEANDFQLLPGQGYVIKAKEDVSITLTGQPVKYESAGDSAPVTLFEGWNLIGLYGTGVKTYTAKTMIADINAANFTADNVSKWEKEKQSYEGFQFSEGEEYGFDFPINTLESVFVRVLEGRGNWQPKLGSQ